MSFKDIDHDALEAELERDRRTKRQIESRKLTDPTEERRRA